MSRSAFDILKRPLITERALNAQEMNKYTFEVDSRASKREIKEAVESAFGVKVTSVNTVNIRGRRVQRQRMSPGKKRDLRKAIITLAPGQALEYT